MKICNDEETYKCDICNKGFHHKRNFDIHMTKHTWLKPYKYLIHTLTLHNKDQYIFRNHKLLQAIRQTRRILKGGLSRRACSPSSSLKVRSIKDDFEFLGLGPAFRSVHISSSLSKSTISLDFTISKVLLFLYEFSMCHRIKFQFLLCSILVLDLTQPPKSNFLFVCHHTSKVYCKLDTSSSYIWINICEHLNYNVSGIFGTPPTFVMKSLNKSI
ncbi:hypothetical protein AGLY_013965 [Aphis glycines]|uniref:C2H2-type domain-containing protein n=1 Tax=Aphis glycines TaxID=307491 RepID=A0A6G0T530_APHGL|nr:hypothetical protein AGLY_013965 [Aphis glycines]